MDDAGNARAVEALRWVGDGRSGYAELLDQRLLPEQFVWVPCRTVDATARAIRDMVVRGAPAIGLAAAYGIVLAAQELGDEFSPAGMEPALRTLDAARPTAVNLAWTIRRMRALLPSTPPEDPCGFLLEEARRIGAEDVASNRAMGDLGAALIPGDRARVLTICNTGSLATAGYGTALGVIRSLHHERRLQLVYACETRPYLQGARLTMWELDQEEIPATLITDSMAGWLMKQGRIDAVVAGADRIAANGDTANKIGTYSLAVLAAAHGIPMYIVAPISSVDLDTPDGSAIPIEERSSDEVVMVRGVRIAPEGSRALHPAFDVTPAERITAIVTEKGVVHAPYAEGLRAVCGR